MKKTISIAFALFAIINFAFAASSTLDAQKQKKVIERVKEYCTLMQEFSGDVEKIENMETIFGICENSNVSVFNDLTVPSAKDISANSMPLQQYMMTLTDKFENNVKTSYSGYKYLKTIVQPSPLEGFDAASYAFVKVNKQVNTGSYKAKMNLHIIVNTETMKVSSTISEDYEDPQSIYLEALTKYNEGKYEEAIPLFSKIAEFNRFAGRYRAMSMQGWAYLKLKDYENAFNTLKKAAEEDPLGGIVLANEMYLAQNIPSKFQSVFEGTKLLEKYSNIRDRELPFMHLIARNALIRLYMKGILEMDFPKMKELMLSFVDDEGANTMYKIIGYCYSAQLNCVNDVRKIQLAKYDVQQADSLVNNCSDPDDVKLKCKRLIALTKYSIMSAEGKGEEGLAYLESNSNLPDICPDIASIYYKEKNYEKAFQYYQKGADNGDAFSAFVVGLSKYPYGLINDFDKVLMGYVPCIKIDSQWLGFVGYVFDDSKQQKSYEEHFKWNTIASNKGEISAMYWESILLFYGIGHETDRCKGLTMLCEAGNSGHRNQSPIFIEWSMMMASKVAQDKDEVSLNCIKNLSNRGNYAADYMLYTYYDLTGDNEKSYEFLRRSCEGEFFEAMQLYGASLLEGGYGKTDTLQAYEIFKKLSKYKNAMAYGILGGIEAEYFHKYELAYEHYKLAMEENDLQGYIGMGELFENGLGVKRNLKMAKECYETAIIAAKRSNLNSVVPEIEKYVARVDSLIALESGNSADNKMILTLNELTNQKFSADARINKSQKLLKEIFAGPKAVVKTVGSNGKTVVSTETAEDFLLRLATMPADKKLVEVSSKKDKNGKYTELTVQMK